MARLEQQARTKSIHGIQINKIWTLPSPSLTPCLGAILLNGCHCNWRSYGCGGYGHYRWVWGGITAHSIALFVCEVEGGKCGGPAAHRDLGLNEKDKSIRRWTENTRTTPAIDKCFFFSGKEHESGVRVSSHSIITMWSTKTIFSKLQGITWNFNFEIQIFLSQKQVLQSSWFKSS